MEETLADLQKQLAEKQTFEGAVSHSFRSLPPSITRRSNTGYILPLSSKAKGGPKKYAMLLMRLSQAEFYLPPALMKLAARDCRMVNIEKLPRAKGLAYTTTLTGERLYTRDSVIIDIPDSKLGIMKYTEEEKVGRLLFKELCFHYHLKDLEGSTIPKMLSFGVVNCEGNAPVFFITEFYGPILTPDEVSPSELGELLNIIHAHGILLACKEEFPRVARVGSKLVLVDFPFTAVFERGDKKFKKEVEFLTGFCKRADTI